MPCVSHREAIGSGSEAGSYLRPIDCLYHSTLDLGVIKTKKELRQQMSSVFCGIA